ncbi:glycosyltransferase family 1 protein [Demequina sp. NBRC 110053]|uniref:glycosyltransferase family 4 protein n=1 Tax=Demequina sp. NBRC 110053 TaxID=1570342 RepID=UPI0009FE576F|nr:glycosyltransferase family 1 protein [Demequina sp. NBRC 110053]
MKVALIAESFLPHANGVTHSLLRVIEHLSARGDEALVIAPEAKGSAGPVRYGVAQVKRLPAMGWPGYDDVRVSLSGSARIARILDDYAPDVVHLASPFMLGWSGVRAAEELSIPSVAVYQTEVPSYADRYRVGWGEPILWDRVLNIHRRAGLTLAPSTYAMRQLEGLGVPRLRLWPRGVDTRRFHPAKRTAGLRRSWAPGGEVIVGYAGRLAAEKRVEDLARLSDIGGIRVVIIGDGPARSRLETLLPHATFTGHLGGEDLARAVASLDVFVHCGELETFCQGIQEAHAAGVPVVAPRRGGPIDLVDPDHTGYLYEPGRLDQMVAGVRALVEEPERRERFSVQARASVAGRTWTSVCDALVGHYAEAISAHHRAPERPWDVLDHEAIRP